MSNVSTLFENLMTYNDVNKVTKSKSKSIVNENDTTLLNLTVELPTESEELTPEDVKVNVGVMNVFKDEDVTENEDSENKDEVEVTEKESEDVTPEDEGSEDSTDKSETKDESKEESLRLRKEAIRQKRLEAKALREANENDTKIEIEETLDDEIEEENIKTEGLFKSAKDIRDIVDQEAKQFGNRFAKSMLAIWTLPTQKESEIDFMNQTFKSAGFKETGRMGDFGPIFEKKVNGVNITGCVYKYHGGFSHLLNYPEKAYKNDKKWKEQFSSQSVIEESASEVETAKANIRKRVATGECVDNVVKAEESLMHLDTKSLNKLISEFVKENYKNIDKVVINKAMLENRMLKLEGIIKNNNGESTKISLTNRGFNPIKLENKRFIMDFKDTSNTFGIVKESLKQPFVFTCILKEGVLTFEELKYSYKTMVESKIAEVYGKCTLKESVEIKNENADQVKKFNEIVEKIKAAKNANDLIACKDEMDESNIGDTLLSAAQMVWDDVNSRMKNSVKTEGIFKKKQSSKITTSQAKQKVVDFARKKRIPEADIARIKTKLAPSVFLDAIENKFNFDDIESISVVGSLFNVIDKQNREIKASFV